MSESSLDTESGGWSIECPACSGLIEGEAREDVLKLGAEHCLDAHEYSIPREHLEIAIRQG